MTSRSSSASPGFARLRPLDIFRGAVMVVALLIVLALLWTVRSFVLVLFFAVLLAIPIASAAGYLKRRFKIPRSAGVAGVILGTVAALFGVGLLLANPIATQMEEVREQFPQAIDRIESWVNSQPFIGRVVLGGSEVAQPDAGGEQQAPQPETGAAPPEASVQQSDPGSSESSLRERVASQLGQHAGTFFPFVMSTVTAIFGVLLVIFLIIYIAVDPSLYASGVLRVVPERHRERTVEVGTEVVKTLKQWLAAQAISMAIIGAITTLALFLLDVRAAIALGILAGIAEFVPVFGPLLAAIPAVGIAFVDSPTKALYVIIAYVVIQQIESNVVAPLVMKRGVDVPPLVTILAGTIMTILFGFLGLLIAVPLAAALLTVARELTVPVDEDQLQEA
jgi:predicted PurR-regulated permease PerM